MKEYSLDVISFSLNNSRTSGCASGIENPFWNVFKIPFSWLFSYSNLHRTRNVYIAVFKKFALSTLSHWLAFSALSENGGLNFPVLLREKSGASASSKTILVVTITFAATWKNLVALCRWKFGLCLSTTLKNGRFCASAALPCGWNRGLYDFWSSRAHL